MPTETTARNPARASAAARARDGRARTGLEAFFSPRSVAVLGASRDPAKLGHVLLKNVIEGGFQGEIWPVNPSGPSGGEVLGRTIHASVEALPEAPDLVLVSVPNVAVPAAIEASARRGARAAVILSSGFGEMGGEGARRQDAVRRAGLRVLGPNCMGIYHLPSHLNGTYFWDLPRREGGLAFVSQSGAYGGMLFSELRRRAMGLSTFVSIGNQADVTHADVMEHLALDPAVRTVALFIEEVRDGERFLAACRLLAREKAVVAFKVGRTTAGRRAAQSHTGSMAGDFEVCLAALRQAGAVVARSTDEFFDLLALLDAHPRLLRARGGLGIVTISGGPCVAAADACEEAGVPVPELSPATQARVRQLVPEFGAVTNPVDMTPQMDPARMAACVDAVSRDKKVRALLAINVGLDRPEFADAFAAVVARKPVFAFVVDDPVISKRFGDAGIPVLSSPERAVRAYAAVCSRAKSTSRPPAAVPAAGHALDEWASRRLLAGAGIPFPKEARVLTALAAAHAADRLGWPVALKALGAGAHKWKRGGVVLDVEDEVSAMVAYRRLARRFGPAVLVQPMVRGEGEVLVGARRDPVFGPTVLFGTGGVDTERARDVSLRVAPLSRDDALAMISETRAGTGLRGPTTAALARILVSLSLWMAKHADVLEVDLNPVIVGGPALSAPMAVDALVVRA